MSSSPSPLSEDSAHYYLTSNHLYRHKIRWRLEQSGQLPVAFNSSSSLSSSTSSARSLSPAESTSSSGSSAHISVPQGAPNPAWSMSTTPESTPVLPPATLRSQDSLVVPPPPLRLPTRGQYPNKPVFAFLWREYDLTRVSAKNAVRNIRDLVDDQTPTRSASKRPRRTERDLVAALWVEGPRRTDAIVRYYKAKARLEKIKGLLSYLHAKYEAESPQTPQEAMPSLFSPTQGEDMSPLTPLPSPLPTIAQPDEPAREPTPSPETTIRSSKRLQARAGQKRRREEDSAAVASEGLACKPPPKRIRLKQSSNHPAPESEVGALKTPVSGTFKGKENALDLTLD
ncbi:hypothetical protein FRC01_000978 [Tulasnella sp. 417]|nr:hypothetical protein FRC01_000978 [Tulasnella sp. 417]